MTGWLDDDKGFVSLSEKEQAINLKLFIRKNHSIINNSTENMIPLDVKTKKIILKLVLESKEKHNINLQIS